MYISSTNRPWAGVFACWLGACSLSNEPDTSAAHLSNVDSGDDTAPPTTGALETTGPGTTGTTTATTTATSTTDDPTGLMTTTPPTTCGNGVVETGEDCDDGDADETDDCTSLCAAPTCDDGIQSGDETDTDCGGPCDGCDGGQACDDHGDCASDTCAAGQCTAVCAPWTRQWGTADDDACTGIARTADDNVYVVSYLANGSSSRVKKYNPLGGQLWTHDITADVGYAAALGIASAGTDFFVVGEIDGHFDDTLQIDLVDGFLRKYDASAATVWTRQLGGDASDSAQGVAIDGAGNIIVSGASNSVFPGNAPLGKYDALVIKYDPAGTRLWTRTFGGPADDDAYSVAVDSNDNIVLVGATAGSFDGNPPVGSQDAFILKLNAKGVQLWSHQLGTPADDYAIGVAIDPSNVIYLTGTVGGSLDKNPALGLDDAFLRKYDQGGNEQWTRQFGTAKNDAGRSVVVAGDGTIAVGGTTSGDLDGNLGAGLGDLFVSLYDPAGARLWTRLLGTKDPEHDGYIAVLTSGATLVAGASEGPLGGPSAGGLDAALGLVCPP